ncbi:MAG: ATP-binding protein [Dehalococcoidia bacterium]|nr:ATP-binding protein [Dehalococcoidia bacterium]
MEEIPKTRQKNQDMMRPTNVPAFGKTSRYHSCNLHGYPIVYYYGDPVKEYTCSPTIVARYQKRISGPLLDRIDIHVEVPRVDYEKLANDRLGEASSAIRARVETARDLQRTRFKDTKLARNDEMTPAEVRDFCRTDAAAQGLLKAAMNQPHLSARGLPPRPETGPHHRRSGRGKHCRRRPPGRVDRFQSRHPYFVLLLAPSPW